MTDQIDIMKMVVYKIITDEVSMDIKPENDGISIQLTLGQHPIGDKFTLLNDVKWKVDKGHGGDSYIDKVKTIVFKNGEKQHKE